MLVESGVSNRVLTAGHEHEGIDLRFGGESHRIDFTDLVGEAVWLYPQNEVVVDLAAARRRDGGDVRFGVSDTAVSDLTSHTPPHLLHGCRRRRSGDPRRDLGRGRRSQGITTWAIPGEHRTDNFIEYPFAWFGILCEASPSAEELIYAHPQHGFALISPRDVNIQRMYFQCSPDEDAAAWSEDPIWAELQKRVDGPGGLELQHGRIFDKTVLKFRSYVCEPMRYGNFFIAGDAGHTVPPTGAKGLNLAFAHVGRCSRASSPGPPPAPGTSSTGTASAPWTACGGRRTSLTG